MESAHLRIFAHLIDDPEFTQSLISGRKEDGTDPHSLNKKKLGELCPDRDRAKTFIFSFLNGAAAPKVATIFDCSLQDARRVLDEYTNAYPGLQYLKSHVMPRDAERGYFVGLDGRLVVCAEERLLIGAYLQNAEAVIMKHANVRWQDELRSQGISFRQVNLVHDEFVTECPAEHSIACHVGRVQAEAIRIVGEQFNLRCPLAGEYKVGKDWLEVH
jgi:DNA polymerase-1